MGNYIDLMKPLEVDSQQMIALKEIFNTDAQNMNLIGLSFLWKEEEN